MAIKLRSPREIELIRGAGAVVAEVLARLEQLAGPGMTTGELDHVAIRLTAEAGGEPLFKGVRSPVSRIAFPGAICASLNEQVVHGIPSNRTVLREGDILSIDFGVRLNGYCGDAAVTIGVGEISPDRRRLLDVTREVLDIAVRGCVPGVPWSRVAGRMQRHAESAGFSVVRDFVGHGIGRQMHEEPRVPNFVAREMQADDFVLAAGMVLAVEPMINAGGCGVKTLGNGWTVVTADGTCSAHFEHTVAVVDGGCRIMTRPSGAGGIEN